MGKRTIWREVGERECGRERGDGGEGVEGRQDSLQASGSASASGSAQILVSELRWLLLRPPMRLGLNGSWVFSGFFSPLRPENLQGYRRCLQVCPHIRWMRSSGVQRVKRFPSTKTRRSRRWQRIASPFAPADHRTDTLMAAISFHFIRDDIIPNSYTAVIVS